MCNWFKFLEK